LILPNKYVPARGSTLGLAATLLPHRHPDQTVSGLWNSYVADNPESSFDRFAEALTLLNIMGLVVFDRGLLRWLR